MKICSRIDCNELAVYYLSKGVKYCLKHYRFRRMRNNAQQRHKYIPSFKELDELLVELENEMQCPNCQQQMVWHNKKGKLSNNISLQHNDNGTIQFLCCSCNSSHGGSKLGDKYFDIPENYKYCPLCDQILNKIQFNKNKNRKDKLNPYCKKCRCVYDKCRYKKTKILI